MPISLMVLKKIGFTQVRGGLQTIQESHPENTPSE